MKIHYTITTDSPYPISSEGIVECNGLQIAARKAVMAHKQTLREKNKLRRWGENTIIKMIKLPDDRSIGND